MNKKAELSVRKQYTTDLAVILLICLLFFVLLEIRFPYFFLNDDNADAYLCMYQHSVRSLLGGEFPFYNFHQFCGKRFLGTGQTGSLNPLVFIAAAVSRLIFGHIDATIDIMALILIMTGSAGAYLFLREIGCTRIPAIIGAVGWNLNTYNICIGDSWIIVMMTTAALPWMYYGTFRLHQRHSVINLLLASVPRIALFYCGHPQFFIYSAIFDFIFAASYVLIDKDKSKKRSRSFIELIGEYAVSYVIVTLACLPLMLPMLDLTAMSERADKLSFETFTSYRLISGVGFFGIISAVFTAVGAILLIFLGVTLGRNFGSYRKEMTGMAASLPVCAISLLWMLSVGFNRIIYLIPILNRFRYQHKLTIITISAVIVISSLTMTVIGKYLQQKRGKPVNVLFAAFLVIQTVSLLGLYMMAPRKTAGIICTSKIPFEEEYADNLAEGRYVSVCFCPVTIDPVSGLQMIDTTSTLEYDLASYFGFNSVSGYYDVMMKSDVKEYSEFFSHVTELSGELPDVYPGFVEEMRGRSVRWYVSDIRNKDAFTAYFGQYGITEVFEDDSKVIFEDSFCEPLAYDEDGNGIALEQKVNSLELTTPAGFAGGEITMNYAHDEYFTCTIDGEPAGIEADSNLWEIKVVCPPGEHHISVRYVERNFYTGLAVSVSGLAVVAAIIALYKVKQGRSVRKTKQEEV